MGKILISYIDFFIIWVYNFILLYLITMMGRVNTDVILSEPVVVKDWYDYCIEKHPGVSNRNYYESRLRGCQSLKFGKYRIYILYLKVGQISDKLGGTAELSLSSLNIGRKAFYFYIYLRNNLLRRFYYGNHIIKGTI